MSTEADICAQFEPGLNYGIRVYLIALKIQEFSTLVKRALKVEQVMNE